VILFDEGPGMQAFEKLGAFYLGRRYEPGKGVTDDLVMYDSKDLTTHAVCVGMTGSGKTGLCLDLLEEAAIDGIPAIAIDPKGDIANLMLTFPDLRAEDFEPWVSADEAARKGRTVAEQAVAVAESWRNGLAEWGQDGERIRRMRQTTDFAIYTPGSNAGRPISLLRSLRAPSAAVAADADAMRERVMSTVSGVLTLLGIEPDPVRSREHILLSTIIDRTWREGGDIEMAELIRLIQKPPLERIGVIDLESFYPAADRFGLAMTINNLLASPGFAAWLDGDPLDVSRLLWTEEGKPRISILSIAHLSETERMFFVTLLLDEIVSWVRTQPGSGSLRAVLYMDEVFGFFPPVANPPSKTPMLTLLKQARAFGLGVVLATQNPVDLDYKGLSNAGTWFLGRLQTERDKMRVLDGLESATGSAGGFDRARVDEILSGLPGRVFLLHNVHEDGPVLMQTRWALSYLRGPITREEIKRLAAAGPAPARPAPSSSPAPSGRTASARPLVPADVMERFAMPVRAASGPIRYRPALLGRARLHFVDAKRKIDEWRDVTLLGAIASKGEDPWAEASRLEREPTLSEVPSGDADFEELAVDATRTASYRTWQKQLSDRLYQDESLTLWSCLALRQVSGPDEEERDFRIRLAQNAREQRDQAIEKLRQKYASKLQTIEQKIRTAHDRVSREQSQYEQQKLQTAISLGASVLGAVFGRKLASVGNVGRATTAARGMGRVGREKDDIVRAQESLGSLAEQKAGIEKQVEAEVAALQAEFDPSALELEPAEIKPRKTDIAAASPILIWLPFAVAADGFPAPLY
jgi:hypothetical protein